MRLREEIQVMCGGPIMEYPIWHPLYMSSLSASINPNAHKFKNGILQISSGKVPLINKNFDVLLYRLHVDGYNSVYFSTPFVDIAEYVTSQYDYTSISSPDSEGHLNSNLFRYDPQIAIRELMNAVDTRMIPILKADMYGIPDDAFLCDESKNAVKNVSELLRSSKFKPDTKVGKLDIIHVNTIDELNEIINTHVSIRIPCYIKFMKFYIEVSPQDDDTAYYLCGHKCFNREEFECTLSAVS